MQDYWIQVFNQQKIGEFPGESLMSALLGVNFQSLCRQYGLDPALIPFTRSHLELVSSPEGLVPYFLLKYQPEGRAPLVIYRWDAADEKGVRWLEETVAHTSFPQVKAQLKKTREILAISLRPAQREGFGLLLAYEVARWSAARGQGLVFGLDGIWYRLNRHQAFLPVEALDQES